jgi:hypothetical protein
MLKAFRMSYGADLNDQFRLAAFYADRILRGEKPADLPLQTADQVCTRDQPQDRQGTWHHSPHVAVRHRRPGD